MNAKPETVLGSCSYYANDVYYTWQPNLSGYVVTEPPKEISEEEQPLIADELFIYPRKGQSEQQQADDRYSCHQWSVSQTRYDPTQPQENIAVTSLNDKREAYQRAMRACLEGKDYSVSDKTIEYRFSSLPTSFRRLQMTTGNTMKNNDYYLMQSNW